MTEIAARVKWLALKRLCVKATPHKNVHIVINTTYQNVSDYCSIIFLLSPSLNNSQYYQRDGTGPAVQPGALPAACASSSFLEKSNSSAIKKAQMINIYTVIAFK